MVPVSRRQVLATGAGMLAAGCTEATPDDTDSPSPSPTEDSPSNGETPSPTPTPNPSLTIRSSSVQSAVIYRISPDSAAVSAPERAQMLLLDVSSDTRDSPDRDEFSLAVGSRTFAPRAVSESGRSIYVGGEAVSPYTSSAGRGWLAFDLPRIDDQSASLRLRTGEGTLREDVPAETVASLASVAKFEVHDVTYRDCSLSLDIENTGDADGTFRAAFNGSGSGYFYKPVRIEVAAGDRDSWERCYDLEASEYELLWAGGSEEFSGD